MCDFVLKKKRDDWDSRFILAVALAMLVGLSSVGNASELFDPVDDPLSDTVQKGLFVRDTKIGVVNIDLSGDGQDDRLLVLESNPSESKNPTLLLYVKKGDQYRKSVTCMACGAENLYLSKLGPKSQPALIARLLPIRSGMPCYRVITVDRNGGLLDEPLDRYFSGTVENQSKYYEELKGQNEILKLKWLTMDDLSSTYTFSITKNWDLYEESKVRRLKPGEMEYIGPNADSRSKEFAKEWEQIQSKETGSLPGDSTRTQQSKPVPEKQEVGEVLKERPSETAGVSSDTLTNSIGMKFKLIPAGSFLMGSPDSEKDWGNEEGPQHKVTLTKPYYLGVYEVTQEQYEKVMGSNPSSFKGAKLPVETVNWNDAQEFCKKLSQLEKNMTYRLPTEAEWEYACRAGTQTAYYWGDTFDEEFAWINNTIWWELQNVGTLKPNAWGLYDMSGNVWEWCEDWYAKKYPTGEQVDPKGAASGSNRVLRGGGWGSRPQSGRSASRNSDAPVSCFGCNGFRVVAVPVAGQ